MDVDQSLLNIAIPEFRDIIQEFGFEIDIGPARVWLVANDVTIVLGIQEGGPEYGSPFACFYQGADRSGKPYSIHSILDMRYPGHVKEWTTNTSWQTEDGLHRWFAICARLMREYCSDILRGNFSWVNDYNTRKKEERQLVEYVFNSLPPNHPLKEKFWRQDKDWREAVRSHMRQEGRLPSLN